MNASLNHSCDDQSSIWQYLFSVELPSALLMAALRNVEMVKCFCMSMNFIDFSSYPNSVNSAYVIVFVGAHVIDKCVYI